MNEGHFQELMNRLLDGEATPAEREALEKHFISNPEDAVRYQELEIVARALDSVKLVDPPEDLVQNVVSRLERYEHSSDSERGFIQRLTSVFHGNVAVRYASVFAAGVVCCFLVLTVASGLTDTGWFDYSGLYGTAVAKLGGFEVTEEASFSVGTSTGSITAKANNKTAITRLEVQSNSEANFKFVFDRNELGFVSFQQEEETEGDFSVDSESITFSHSGSNVYKIVLKKKIDCGSYIDLTVDSEGQSYSTALSTCSQSCGGGDSDH